MIRFSLAFALSMTLAQLAIAGPAHGATSCVTTAAELQQALDVAAVNEQNDFINLAQGAYESPAGGFIYREHKSDYGKALKIVGGWTGNKKEPCQEYSPVRGLTTIDGNGRNRGMDLQTGPDSTVGVWFLTFLEGVADGKRICGGGLRITTEESGASSIHSASVSVYLSWFLLNRAGVGGGLCVASSREIHVVNSVFVGNHAKIVGGGLSLQNGNPMDGQSWAKLYVTNNMVLGNTTKNYAAGGIAVLHGDEAVIANNLVWNNSNYDIQLGFMGAPADSLEALVIHNDFRHLSYESHVGVKQDGNIEVAPVFEPGLFNYTPVSSSPLIDSGFDPDGTYGIQLTPWDFYGNARIANKRIDIGAVEVQ